MIQFFVQNMATIFIGIAVLVITGFVSFKLIRDKRNGKSACGCDCSSCPGSCGHK